MKKKILITGANGYIGSKLVIDLILKGFDLSIIVRKDSNLSLLKNVTDKINIYYHNNSIESIVNIFKISKPDVVIHLASLFISQHQPSDIKNLIESNIEYGTYLLEGMVQNGIKNIINTSSYWLHFNNEEYNPVNLYAATKKAFLDILFYYKELYDLNVITLELADIYGVDDPRKKLINILKEAVKYDNELLISPGEQYIDLVYIDDVINAYNIALEKLINTNANIYANYAVTSGNAISIKSLIQKIETIIGRKCNNIKIGAKQYRKREIFKKINFNKTIENWKPIISLETGLKKIFLNSNNNEN